MCHIFSPEAGNHGDYWGEGRHHLYTCLHSHTQTKISVQFSKWIKMNSQHESKLSTVIIGLRGGHHLYNCLHSHTHTHSIFKLKNRNISLILKMNQLCATNLLCLSYFAIQNYRFSRDMSKWVIHDNKWGNISWRPRWGQFSLRTNHVWCDQIFSPNFDRNQSQIALFWYLMQSGSFPCGHIW